MRAHVWCKPRNAARLCCQKTNTRKIAKNLSTFWGRDIVDQEKNAFQARSPIKSSYEVYAEEWFGFAVIPTLSLGWSSQEKFRFNPTPSRHNLPNIIHKNAKILKKQMAMVLKPRSCAWLTSNSYPCRIMGPEPIYRLKCVLGYHKNL